MVVADNPVPITKIKGDPVTLFGRYGAVSPAADKLSDDYVDCRNYNAVSVTVYIPVGFTVTVTVQGGPDPRGIYLTLPDGQATQPALTTSKVFDCTVGQAYVKILLSGVVVPGGNPSNNGIVVIVTPYDAAGQSNITITATASQNLTEIGGGAVTLGQKAMAGSLPVTLPSDETVPVSVATLPASLGQKAMAASLPVVLASDQAAVTVSDTKLPVALGQTTMAGSLPVTLPSNPTTIPVNNVASATGGATPTLKRNLGTVVAVKAGAGNLAGLQIINTQATLAAYVQVFDAATGSVVLGTTVPVLEILVPAASSVSATLPPEGVNFATAISIASTTAEFGNTASAAGVCANAQYS